jgi:hypothetical protein
LAASTKKNNQHNEENNAEASEITIYVDNILMEINYIDRISHNKTVSES